MGRRFYIRYRIYLQTSKRPDRGYPRRVIKNLKNLHNNINPAFRTRNTEQEKIKSRIYLPENLDNVGDKYYNLIRNLTHYFECIAIWEKTMIPGTTSTINTFTIYGYEQDLLLAFHYIKKLINALNRLRSRIQDEFRNTRVQLQTKGVKTKARLNAKVKASKFFYRSLGRIIKVTEEILENKEFSPNFTKKEEEILKVINKEKSLNFRNFKYKNEPKIEHAFCRPGKFQNKRIIK